MRKRLTSKQLFAENRKDGLFPGDIGNEERDEKYYDVKEFNNEASEFKPGWDLAEKYDIEDKRDEMNFGIHKDVKAFNLAQRAIMLAHMFLGSKASEKQIEYQASQFMKMGAKGVAASIKLWKATEDVPEETEEVEKTACDEVKVEDKEACKACEDAPAAPVEETKTAGETCEETPADEKVKTDLTDAEDTIAKEEKNDVSELEACDDETEPALEVEVTPEVAPFETDLTVDEVKPDPTLEAIFAGEEVALPEEKPTEKTASKKGISHMAQPKLNPNKDENEVKKLSMIWTDLAVPNNL